MKCPLLMIAYLLLPSYKDGTNRPSALCDCLKEECAWWDDGSKACAIWSLMSGLDALGKLFREIGEKMLHIEQFTKQK